jgi:hypothetical protein
MTSLGIEKDFTPKVIRLFGRGSGNVFPGLVICQKHAIVFCGPAFIPVGPVDTCQVKNLP